MTAAEIIELIKKLPPEERAEVMAFLERELGGGRVEETGTSYGTPERKLRYMRLDEAVRIAEGVFDRHTELFRKLAQ